MQGNIHFRAPRPMNRQPAQVIPHLPSNVYSSSYGYLQQYPETRYQDRGPVFPSVYEYHHLEDHQTYGNNYPEMNGQLTQPNPRWNNESYHESQTDDVSHSESTFHKKQQHHHFSSQVKQPSQQPGHSARFPQRNATAAPIVRHPAPAVQTRNAPALYRPSGSQQQQRANKPGYVQSRPVVMLPVPKPKAIKRLPDDESQTAGTSQPPQKFQKQKSQQPKEVQQSSSTKNEPPPFDKLTLYFERLLLGTIPQLFKWNLVRHKHPPIYETVGTLMRRIETVEGRQQMTESHFSLRNLSKWQRNGKSANEVLECVFYTTGNRRYNFSVDIHIRIIGRFLPSGLFLCLKVRRATESDIAILTSHVNGKAATINSSHPSTSRDTTFSEPANFEEALTGLNQMDGDDSLDPIFMPF